MVEPGRESAVLLTGAYGSGKSSVAAEIADILEMRGSAYAYLDLDFFSWAGTPQISATPGDALLLANLAAVMPNFRAVGVRFYVLAYSVRDRAELEAIRSTLGCDVSVVRLVVPIEEIRRRLAADVTSGRLDDLRVAERWLAAGTGEGLEHVAVRGERPVREIATEIVGWLGWDDEGATPGDG